MTVTKAPPFPKRRTGHPRIPSQRPAHPPIPSFILFSRGEWTYFERFFHSFNTKEWAPSITASALSRDTCAFDRRLRFVRPLFFLLLPEIFSLAGPGCPSSYLAWEPAARTRLWRAASSTTSRPVCARWPLWPRSRPGETSIADTDAAVRDRTAPPSAPLPPATSASWYCPAC